MAETPQLQDEIQKAIDAKKTGGESTEKKDDAKEVADDKKDGTVIDEVKKEENKNDANLEKKEEDKKEDEFDKPSVIKIAAKKVEPKDEDENKEDEDGITDEALLKLLSKKSGKEIKSLDEILNPKKELTEEDKQKEKEKRDADKIAYGLQNGLITEKKLTKYFADSKNKKNLVFEEYWQQASSEDKTLTKTKAEEEFNERFGLDGEEDTRMYKRGMQEINSLADQIIRNEYPEVFELERNFSDHEKTLTTTKQKEATILQKAPLYKKDVEAAFDEIKTIKVSRTNETTKQLEEFDIELDKSILEPYKNQMLEKEYAEKQILSGWDKEAIKANYQGAAILGSLPEIVFSAIDQALLKREKGLRGVTPTKEFTGRKEQATETVKEKVKAELEDRFKKTTEKAAQAN